MATVVITHRLDMGAVNTLLRSPGSRVAQDLYRRGLNVETAAKRLAPVDQGILRASIGVRRRFTTAGPEVAVGTDVHYALFQELGTRFMRARPYLRPGLRAARG